MKIKIFHVVILAARTQAKLEQIASEINNSEGSKTNAKKGKAIIYAGKHALTAYS